MVDFNDQVVLVSGGRGNLGAAVVRTFHQAGARVIATDHATGSLAAQFPELDGASNAFLAEGVDVTDAQAVDQLVEQVLRRFQRIDVLVNTVGGYRAGTPVHLTPLDAWDFMLNLNARSTFVVSRAVVPVMLDQGPGKIVNVAASSALKGSANSAAYAASKSAVARLTESMAEEYKRQGINVNAVLPGTLDTPQNRQAMPDADFSLWVTPQAMAQVILFLASQGADPIHGALIPVYGRK
jgi:NAD(P)-dependent dehydrogenase (short-subunit alcohol dehydrogenase family)